ncbi:MAG TPA: hypothetical protein VME23_03060 [Terracidiphilus sp.]|nr:hypothetical protein [Terracidiphilus sp.]
MPALTSREGIRAFIACVARGVVIEAIRENTSSRLLYAAQVALGDSRANPTTPFPPPAPRKTGSAPRTVPIS